MIDDCRKKSDYNIVTYVNEYDTQEVGLNIKIAIQVRTGRYSFMK